MLITPKSNFKEAKSAAAHRLTAGSSDGFLGAVPPDPPSQIGHDGILVKGAGFVSAGDGFD